VLRVVLLSILLFFVSAYGAVAQDFSETKAQAESGDAAAQAELGVLYQLGDGAAQDDAEAFAWYQKAANQGNARGQARL